VNNTMGRTAGVESEADQPRSGLPTTESPTNNHTHPHHGPRSRTAARQRRVEGLSPSDNVALWWCGGLPASNGITSGSRRRERGV
jgi:hypothetical protein